MIVSLLAEVARSYFALRGTQHRLAVARRNADNQRQPLDLTMALLEGGRGTELDTSRAEAQRQSTLASIPPLETAASRHAVTCCTPRHRRVRRHRIWRASAINSAWQIF